MPTRDLETHNLYWRLFRSLPRRKWTIFPSGAHCTPLYKCLLDPVANNFLHAQQAIAPAPTTALHSEGYR